MRKLIKLAFVMLALWAIVYCVALVKDHSELGDQILRLHVVADSDDEQAQAVKLEVRDAVLSVLNQITDGASTKEEVMEIIRQNLNKLEAAANSVLQKYPQLHSAVVSLQQEAFPKRVYDTFSLPSGVYDSLRITIGSGEGKNWWCVVFPGLCIPAASEEVADTAVAAGFSEDLTRTITGEEGYELRFWILDQIGRVRNFFHMG